jgi:hypothetical protein
MIVNILGIILGGLIFYGFITLIEKIDQETMKDWMDL